MRQRMPNNHAVDALFTIAVFLMFTASVLTVTAISLSAYRAIASQTSETYNARTGLSYLSQKLRHAEQANSVSLGELDGVPALLLTEQHGEETYTTYIYEDSGTLRELFIKDGTQAAPGSGTAILDISSFVMEQPESSLFRFSVTDSDGRTYELLVHPRGTG